MFALTDGDTTSKLFRVNSEHSFCTKVDFHLNKKDVQCARNGMRSENSGNHGKSQVFKIIFHLFRRVKLHIKPSNKLHLLTKHIACNISIQSLRMVHTFRSDLFGEACVHLVKML